MRYLCTVDAAKFSRSDIELNRKLGKGTFGIVWSGKCKEQTVAIKFINKTEHAKYLKKEVSSYNYCH